MRHHSKMILYVSLLLIFTLGICAALSSAAAVWTFVDGDGDTGLNLDTTRDALQPRLSAYQGDLYAIWTETNGTAGQTRVKKYSGGNWSFVDGGAAAGLNGDPGMDASHPTLTVYNDTLVAAWIENTVNGSAIRVKKYDGNSWAWIDEGGLNYSTEATVGAPALLVTGGNLYVAWAETALGGANGSSQIRIKKYDGYSWIFVDGGATTGLNYNSTQSAENPRLAVFNLTIYAAWDETSSGVSQIRVKKYFTSGSWAFVDGGGAVGLNWNPAKNAERPQLLECNGALYVAWEEQNFYNTNYESIRFKKFNGTTWTFTDGGTSAGLNKSPTNDARDLAIESHGSFLYLSWTEGDFSNGIPQIRVARSFNTGCYFIDGNSQTGLNKNIYTHGGTPALAATTTDLYLAWSEKFGDVSQFRVRKLPLPATVTSVTVPANGTYGPGQTLDFTVYFSKPVYVSTPPSILLTLDTGGSVYAGYLSGTGTNAISFRYTVQSGNQDTNGITINQLTPGGITPLGDADNPADLTLHGVGSTAGILVDGVGPKPLSGTMPVNGTYIAGQNLDIALNFNESVFVDTSAGTPELPVGFDTGTGNMVTVKALYFRGSGTSSMWFRYTVKPGDLDTNGISAGSMNLTTNGATIRDIYGNNASLLLPTFGINPGVLVDAVNPKVSQVSLLPAMGGYVAGKNMDIQVTFTENITVNTTNGAPYIPVTLDTGTVNATYSSGSGTTRLVFRYTIQPGDLDQNGVIFGTSITLNSGTLKDAATNDAVLTLNNLTFMTGILVDGVAPTVVSVTVPADGYYNTFTPPTSGIKGFTVYFNEPVKVTLGTGRPYIPVTLDSGVTLQASYYSGTGTNALVFTITVIPPNTLDLTGITLGSAIILGGGVITDNSNNNAVLTLNNLPSTAGIFIDNIAPTVSSLTPPANGIYLAGQDLNLIVNFNEPVVVNTTGGVPYLRGIFDCFSGSPVIETQFPYVSGSGTNALIFKYTIKPGDLDVNGINMHPLIALNGGTIRDLATNNTSLTLNNIGSTSGVQIIAAPARCWMSARPNIGSYIAGQNLNFTFRFIEPVFVDTSGGTPYIPVILNSGTVKAYYISGSGTTDLLFSYTVTHGDMDSDGINIGPAIVANGGSIRDIINVEAVLTHNSGSLINNVLVDTQEPTIVSVSVPTPGAYPAGSNLDFKVTFSEKVMVKSTVNGPYLPIILETETVNALYVIGGSGTNMLSFRYTVQAGNLDMDGITLGSEITNSLGKVIDLAGNNAISTLNNVGDTRSVRVDTAPPVLEGASRMDDTHLIVTLNEDCLNLTQNNNGGFTLVEVGSRGLIYQVLATAQGTNAGEVILTISNLDASAKYGLLIKYTANGSGTIRDVAGNILASENVGLTVAPWSENRPPQLADPGPLSVDEGQLIRFTLTGNDPDRDPLTYSVGNQPAGSSFNPANAEFIWTPTYKDSGIYSLQFAVSDGEKSTSQTVTLNVADLGTLIRVSLFNSSGSGIAGGQVTYAGSSWQTMGATGADGSLTMLLPSATSGITVRMTYQGMNRDLAQNINYNPNFNFTTVNATVNFQDSAGNGIDGGVITYAGSSWLSFGTTDSSGAATKELLPGSYKFRMTYGGASLDQTQDVAVDPRVSFETKPVTITLKDSAGNGIAGGVVTYAGSSWSSFGTTNSVGTVSKELLPVSYKFRITYAGAAIDQTQNVAVNPQVTFGTQPVTVTLKDSAGNGIAGGVVTFAGSSWLNFGTTDSTGTVSKELLPVSYTFRITYAGASVDQSQDTAINPAISFQTRNVLITLKDSLGNGLAGGVVSYAGSSWLSFGTTDDNGEICKELLSTSYTFRMTYAGRTVDQVLDVGGNNLVEFQF